jgi:hypothetical protein
MIGKKNIVFGLIYLVFTAALGPYMVIMYENWGAANAEKQTNVGRLQQLKANDFEEDLEALSGEQIAKANTNAILSMSKLGNAEFEIDYIKGGPHAHGNLESVLNIIVGIVLMFIAAPVLWKQIASWLFIVGAVFHSGLLYFERVFHMAWASSAINTIGIIGPAALLLGLLFLGFMAATKLEPRIVQD